MSRFASTRRAIPAALLLLGIGAGSPARAEAQVQIGGHMAYAVDAFDGTTGVGGRIGWNVPVLPMDLGISGEYFFPDCGDADCGLWGGSLDARLWLPIPLIRPYVTAGYSYRDFSGFRSSPDTEESGSVGGFNGGVGVDANLLLLNVYLEARYEALEAPVEQWVIRLGLYF